MKLGAVPNHVFRERYLELHRAEDLTLCELAERMGLPKRPSTGKPDTTQLARALGLKPYTTRGRHLEPVQTCSYRMAVMFCEALHVDPWEAGI